jgi:hypothetical protein
VLPLQGKKLKTFFSAWEELGLPPFSKYFFEFYYSFREQLLFFATTNNIINNNNTTTTKTKTTTMTKYNPENQRKTF